VPATTQHEDLMAAARSSPAMNAGTAAQFPADNYIHTRDIAIRIGLDAIGSPTYASGGSSATATYGELLRDAAGSRRERQPAMPRWGLPFNM
jgi:hypothetical protein